MGPRPHQERLQPHNAFSRRHVDNACPLGQLGVDELPGFDRYGPHR
jgi:hypothetical protein